MSSIMLTKSKLILLSVFRFLVILPINFILSQLVSQKIERSSINSVILHELFMCNAAVIRERRIPMSLKSMVSLVKVSPRISVYSID